MTDTAYLAALRVELANLTVRGSARAAQVEAEIARVTGQPVKPQRRAVREPEETR